MKFHNSHIYIKYIDSFKLNTNIFNNTYLLLKALKEAGFLVSSNETG